MADLSKRMALATAERVHNFAQDNEEGQLGFALHPRFKDNGQLFVYYNAADEPRVAYLSRFRMSPNDPNRADPESEERIILKSRQQWPTFTCLAFRSIRSAVWCDVSELLAAVCFHSGRAGRNFMTNWSRTKSPGSEFRVIHDHKPPTGSPGWHETPFAKL